MIHQKPDISLRTYEAAIIMLFVISGISYGMIHLALVPHISMLFGIITLLIYGISKKVKVTDMEKSMVEGARAGLGAVMIFFFIGMLVSSWLASGTIPTLIYIAFHLVSVKWFYAIVFIITSFVGISIGSSLTTSAVIGTAFLAVSETSGLSSAITAGAVVSGAFFGDKMSPLSDTTILASGTVKVTLFDHIRNMCWTTVPAFLFSLILYVWISPEESTVHFAKLIQIKKDLVSTGLIHWYSLIPLLLLAYLSFKRINTLITLGAASISAILISFVVTEKSQWINILQSLFSGYESKSGNEQLDALLSRGGIESMFFTVTLVLLALSLGGLLFNLGIVPSLLKSIQKKLEKKSVLISSTAVSAMGINLLIGEQYLSILLTGNTFLPHYKKAGIHPKNLSRVLEDAGTVVNPLVPWSVCGAFLSGVLGVETTHYFSFAFFCLLSPLLTLIAGFTGITTSVSNQKAA